jgi:hypothetical protein
VTNLIDSTPDEPFQGLEPASSPMSTPEPAPTQQAPTQEPDTFDRAYVEELRREAAGYRTQLREVESYFDGYTPEERDALGQYLQLSRAAEQGDQEAIAILNELFDDGQNVDDQMDDPFDMPMLDEDYLREMARQEAYELFSQEQAQRDQEQAVAQVQSTAEQMGYDQGSEDYILLLKFANDLDPAEHPDLLAAADQQVKAYKQQIIDSYINEKQQQANGPRTPQSNGSAPSLAQPPRTLAEARQALHDRLMRDFG